MSIFNQIFGEPEIRALKAPYKAEIKKLIDELIVIGKTDEYLSIVPGGLFDHQCHHRQAKEIGKRVHEIGGIELMWAVRQTIRYKLKDVMAEHLDHCWKGIGSWQA